MIAISQVERFPASPSVQPNGQAPLVALMGKTLAAKPANPAAEGGTGIPACASTPSQTGMSVSPWERVYRLHGLTPAEIKLVDEGAGR